MRRVNAIYIGIIASIISVFIISINYFHEDYNMFIIMIPALWFVILANSEYFSNQPLGYSNWINPILKLSVLLIKLDGVERTSETKRIINYLNQEFDPVTSRIKFRYYKKVLMQKQNFDSICERIRLQSGSIEKIRVLQHLIKVALSDRLLTDKEQEFIETVCNKLRIPRITLNAILQLHVYITEEDIRNQKLNKTYVNSSSKKAYSILGLELGATMDEVKDAYRELVKIYHPDKLKKNERNKEQAKIKFQAISDAYQFLKKEI